jgi:hypothetical protein
VWDPLPSFSNSVSRNSELSGTSYICLPTRQVLLDFEVLIDNKEWLELFHPFIAIRTLRLSGKLQSQVVSSLQELTMEGLMEVLPTLQSIYIIHKNSEGKYHQEQQSIEVFFAQCQHGRSVTLQST